MKHTFAQNLALLAERDPLLAEQVERIDPTTLPLIQTEEEEKTHWKTIPLSETKALFVFGIGSGAFYLCAKEWLEKERSHLIFIEDDLRALHHFLGKKEATDLLQNPRVRITSFLFNPKEPDLLNTFCEKLAWYYNFLTPTITALPSHLKARPGRFHLLRDTLAHQFHYTKLYILHHGDLGGESLSCAYRNFLSAPNTPLGTDLFGKCAKIPALICGAGPSLEKQLPLLRSLQDKALIIATGSAISILDDAGIPFHLGLVVDFRLSLSRLSSLRPGYGKIFYQMRANPPLLSFLSPELLLLPENSIYPIETWLAEKLQLSSPYDLSGYTVGDISGKIASYLGCDPILFVGVDLAFTEKAYYAKSASFTDTLSKNELPCTDIYGHPALTKPDWLLSSEKISELPYTFPDRTYLNATEGGIGFAPIPNLPLEEAIRTHLTQSWDLSSLLASLATCCSSVPFTKEQVEKLLFQTNESLARCEILLEGMLLELLTILEEGKKETNPALPLSEKFKVLEQRLKKEETYGPFLKFYWEIFDKVLERSRAEIERQLSPKGREWRHKKTEVEFLLKTAKEHLELLRKVNE